MIRTQPVTASAYNNVGKEVLPMSRSVETGPRRSVPHPLSTRGHVGTTSACLLRRLGFHMPGRRRTESATAWACSLLMSCDPWRARSELSSSAVAVGLICHVTRLAPESWTGPRRPRWSSPHRNNNRTSQRIDILRLPRQHLLTRVRCAAIYYDTAGGVVRLRRFPPLATAYSVRCRWYIYISVCRVMKSIADRELPSTHG
jgi:hypothetical protein